MEQQLEEDYATLEEMKKEVEQEKASVEQEKASVAALMKQRETELAGIEGNIDSAQSDADYYAAEIQAQEEIIAEIRRIEAEKAAPVNRITLYRRCVYLAVSEQYACDQ